MPFLNQFHARIVDMCRINFQIFVADFAYDMRNVIGLDASSPDANLRSYRGLANNLSAAMRMSKVRPYFTLTTLDCVPVCTIFRDCEREERYGFNLSDQ